MAIRPRKAPGPDNREPIRSPTNFPAGTLIVKTKDNPADLYERMQQLAANFGVNIYPTDTAWVE